ncbi:MAG: CoA-binding protein [Gammaproteobacteria bacterium]
MQTRTEKDIKAIEQFLKAETFAVLGATGDRSKYGNKVLRCYLQHQKNNQRIYAINLRGSSRIENTPCFPSLSDLPEPVTSISIITPPKITEEIVKEAWAQKVQNIWMQPGAESEAAIEFCEKNNLNVIAGGPCILVELGFKDI